MPSVRFVERRVNVLGPVIGAEAARAIAHRDALRVAALILGWIAMVPAATWAQMAGGPLAWSMAALALAAWDSSPPVWCSGTEGRKSPTNMSDNSSDTRCVWAAT